MDAMDRHQTNDTMPMLRRQSSKVVRMLDPSGRVVVPSFEAEQMREVKSLDSPPRSRRQSQSPDGAVDASFGDTGSPLVSRPNLDAFIPKEVSAQQVLQALIQDIRRARNYGAMPLYIVFIVVFTVLIWITSVTPAEPQHRLNKRTEQLGRGEQAQSVGSRAEWWVWIGEVVDELWRLREPRRCSDEFRLHPDTTAQGSPAAGSGGAEVQRVGSAVECCMMCMGAGTCKHFTFSPVGTQGEGHCRLFGSVNFTTLADGVTYGKNHLDTRRGSPVVSFPVGALVLRQWRSRDAACPVTESHFTVVGPAERDALQQWPGGCVLDWTPPTGSSEPFGPLEADDVQLSRQRPAKDGAPWIADGQLERDARVPPVGTEREATFRSFDSQSKQFSQILSFQRNKTDVEGHLEELRDGEWLDGSTRAIIVEFFVFSPEQKSNGPTFAFFTAFFEFSITGQVLAESSSFPFTVWSTGSSMGTFVFALDVLLMVLLLFLVLEFVRHMRKKGRTMWATRESWIGGWEMFELINIFTFIITYVYRFKLWSLSAGPTSEGYFKDKLPSYGECGSICEQRILFDTLSDYATSARVSADFYAPSIVIAYIRFFKFLQFNERMNILSQTVSEATDDLIGMLLIFFIILLGYTLAGTLLYATEIETFNTPDKTMSYLTRVVFNGDFSLWDEQKEASDLWTAPYNFTFMMLCWVVLLNMVLAVIAGSFAVIQESMERSQDRWKLLSVGRDLWLYTNKFVLRRPETKDMDDPGAPRGACNIRWISRYVTRRVHYMEALRTTYAREDHGVEPGKIPWDSRYLTQEQLKKIAHRARARGEHVLTDAELSTLLRDVQMATGSDAKRGNERGMAALFAGVTEVKTRLETLQGHVLNLRSTTTAHTDLIQTVRASCAAALDRIDFAKLSLEAGNLKTKEVIERVKEELGNAMGDVMRRQEDIEHLAGDISYGVQLQLPILEQVHADLTPAQRAHGNVPLTAGKKTRDCASRSASDRRSGPVDLGLSTSGPPGSCALEATRSGTAMRALSHSIGGGTTLPTVSNSPVTPLREPSARGMPQDSDSEDGHAAGALAHPPEHPAWRSPGGAVHPGDRRIRKRSGGVGSSQIAPGGAGATPPMAPPRRPGLARGSGAGRTSPRQPVSPQVLSSGAPSLGSADVSPLNPGFK
eukprot:TRINITY_DN46714_c0_g1_i1.p1 TRINITY_DN46714_c0_g1~~TRINITY_DN46714_c0_g1_i1.p1  ORF type:complete len:1163 (+),score=282.28 TRINITY_DN46714_c0_g1_i1:85-3573(+)